MQKVIPLIKEGKMDEVTTISKNEGVPLTTEIGKMTTELKNQSTEELGAGIANVSAIVDKTSYILYKCFGE